MYVKPKKELGQHFLRDEDIALRIVDALQGNGGTATATPIVATKADKTDANSQEAIATEKAKMEVLEIGPGMGVLTKYLLKREDVNLKVAEIDKESVNYLLINYPEIASGLYEADFLKMSLDHIFKGDFNIIGNFPYNISSQIFFKVLDYKDQIPQVVGMLQKEVAERLCSPAGKKSYGILSVLLQAWYNMEYLFTVESFSFIPPPKVRSAVIRLTRNDRTELGCDPVLFKSIIKTCFNQRRKTIRNSIRPLIVNMKNNLMQAQQKGKSYERTKNTETISGKKNLAIPEIMGTNLKGQEVNFLDLRPEQMSVEMFIKLTNELQNLYIQA